MLQIPSHSLGGTLLLVGWGSSSCVLSITAGLSPSSWCWACPLQSWPHQSSNSSIQLVSLFPLSSQSQVLASHQKHIRVSRHPKFVFQFCWGQKPCWQQRLFPWVPPDTMKFEINGGKTKTSPSWKSRAGLVAFLWYEMPLQPASFFFPPLQIFYPFKANSLSSGWELLSKEVSTKAEKANQHLSPLSR